MNNTITNFNILDLEYLVFSGVVLGSAAVIYLVGYTTYLGYNYYFNNTSNLSDIGSISPNSTIRPNLTTTPNSPTSSSDTSSSVTVKGNIIDIPTIKVDNVDSIDPLPNLSISSRTSLSPFDSNTPIDSLPDNLRLLNSDVSIDAVPSISEIGLQTSDAIPNVKDLGVQTDDQLLIDTLNQLLDERNSEREELTSAISDDIYSPISPTSDAITRFFNSLNPATTSISTQTSPINIDTPVLNQLRVITRDLNTLNSNITPISSISNNNKLGTVKYDYLAWAETLPTLFFFC